MAIDDLALCLEISKDVLATEQIIRKELGASGEEQSLSSRQGHELFGSIKSRQTGEGLPVMQIDGSIEFKPAD